MNKKLMLIYNNNTLILLPNIYICYKEVKFVSLIVYVRKTPEPSNRFGYDRHWILAYDLCYHN